MYKDKKTLHLRLDTYTRVCLTATVILLTVLIIALWANHVPLVGEAQAKAGGPFLATSTQMQLMQLVKAQDKTTAKVDAILRFLESGQMKVQLVEKKDKGKGVQHAPVKARK